MKSKDYKNFRFYGIIALISIISVPIILNFILQLSFPNIRIIGNIDTWLGFWSAYSGSVIGSMITLFVLYKTLRQNQENHKTQIDFQIEAIKHQGNKEWLNNLKIETLKNLSILNFEKIESLVSLIKIQSSNIDLIEKISAHEEKIKSSKMTFKILYNNQFSHKEQVEYKKNLENLVSQNLEILFTFKNYIVVLERNIDNFSRFNEVKDIVKEEDRAILENSKQESFKMGIKKKEEIEEIIRKFKKGILLINSNLEKSTIDLIKFEEQKIFKGLIEKLN
ncbi:hypothetical protein [Algoriphagus sp. Y33]|uniref:hypothetical protein n=1 Tax=Algoriphagus sp. Y33 TaxID=2772483 RepID=UPI001783A314|nr:hypothetical protein [Algoriphagus sp. Y33]